MERYLTESDKLESYKSGDKNMYNFRKAEAKFKELYEISKNSCKLSKYIANSVIEILEGKIEGKKVATVELFD